ncbi:hypothetical protein [Paraburkholderia sp. BL6665CI2N2]|nr:hypothetical protein [Paraburkholderia sp. BL6665CI2N2]
MLLIVLIVSIIVPVACFVGYCYRDYVFRKADANDVIMRLVRVAQ